MITKFDSSYYGTVDMENLGYAGTPINERRYSQAELGRALRHVRFWHHPAFPTAVW